MIFDKLKRKREYMSWSQWQKMVDATNDLGITHHFAKKAMKGWYK